MRKLRVSIVLSVVLLLVGAGCSTSGDDAGPSTTRSGPSATPPASLTPTSPPSSSSPPTTAGAATPTTAEAGPTVAACDLLEPADLTAAGIEGTIVEDGDVSDNFSLGTAPSTACGYGIEQANKTIGITVLVSDGVGADALDDATDFADDPQEVSGVGDRAIYSEEDGMMDATENAIYAQQGTRLIKISSVDATFTPQATLEALARTLLSA